MPAFHSPQAQSQLERSQLLADLRGPDRLPADPSAGPVLRQALEEPIEPLVAALPEGRNLRITKARVRDVLACETFAVLRATPSPGAQANPAAIAGRLVDRLFAHVVAGGALPAHPVRLALRSAAVAGDLALVAGWEVLGRAGQDEAQAVVDTAATDLALRWPPLPREAWPRLEEMLRVELAGGRVVLSGRVDLMIGLPAPTRRGVTLIDVKSGGYRFDHAADAAFYGLLETVRHGVAPHQVGTYYATTGRVDLVPFDDDLADRAAGRVGDAIRRLGEIAAGRQPARSPGPRCHHCPGLHGCEPGRRAVAETDG